MLHADDIRAAAGRTAPADVDTKPAASHIADVLTQQQWRPATIALAAFGLADSANIYARS